MFSKDFFPTPQEVIKEMLVGISVSDKYVYDPSSGKGDILKYCKRRGATALGSEINEDLYKISSTHAKMIATDFLEVQRVDISHVDYIIMNPPFSADIKHILHAWDIAPSGCEIRTLCNSSTLDTGTNNVNKLASIVTANGKLRELGSCFMDSERKTSVEVSMISLKKPEIEEEDWSEYFDKAEYAESEEYGVMPHDSITEIVGRYVGSLKMFKTVEEMSDKINDMMSPINPAKISFGCTKQDPSYRSVSTLSFNEFKIELQKSAWTTVFSKMKMGKYMTEALKEKINKFVEQQSETPFTVKNIFAMLQFIHEGQAGRMDEVLVEVFDTLTKHYSDNRHFVEGWKTNSHYMINQKVIVPYMTTLRSGGGMEIHYNGNGKKIDDLVKALCYVTGENYDNYSSLERWVSHVPIMDEDWYRNSEDIISRAKSSFKYYSEKWDTPQTWKDKWTEETYVEHEINRAIREKRHYERREFGKWYDWGFFEVKGFKKGTMHFKFKDASVWEMFNRRVAEIKGYELPENLK